MLRLPKQSDRGSVTGMETLLLCRCPHGDDGKGVLVRVGGDALLRRRPKWSLGDFLVCRQCWEDHAGRSWRIPESPGNLGATVSGLYGGTEPTDPLPCEGCGRVVIRGKNTRTKRHTCSRACTVAASKRAHGKGASGPVTSRCAECGTTITGRGDRTYCSSACRQRAYRARQTSGKVSTTPEPRWAGRTPSGLSAP